jgi:hypothetical protein
MFVARAEVSEPKTEREILERYRMARKNTMRVAKPVHDNGNLTPARRHSAQWESALAKAPVVVSIPLPKPVPVPAAKVAPVAKKVLTIGEVVREWRDRTQFPEGCTMPAWAREIVRVVANERQITVNDIMRRSRKRTICAARNEAMYKVFARKESHPIMSLPVVGKWFGNRDHTSVLYGICQHSLRTGAPQLSTLDVERHIAQKRAAARRSYERQKARTLRPLSRSGPHDLLP